MPSPRGTRCAASTRPSGRAGTSYVARGVTSTARAFVPFVDVTERSTSLVLARPDGRVEAAHLVPLGLGMGADHVVVRASLDNVRRWLPWPIDAPALLERVFNRSRLSG